MRYFLLRLLFKIAPFDLDGNLEITPKNCSLPLSCLICTSGRGENFHQLLTDLTQQTLGKNSFEVVIYNDGGGKKIMDSIGNFCSQLSIVCAENKFPKRTIGILRNKTVEMSSGKFLLFLDDDTRISQKDFLENLLEIFGSQTPDVIIPHGKALYGLVSKHHDYLDSFSFATRCCAYSRQILEQLKGFNKDLNSYEDIELSIRLVIAKAKILKTDKLWYLHPPLYFDSLKKPFSIGQSILAMRPHYSFPVWLLAYVNALRFLPYCLFPTQRNLQWFRISLGVLLAPFKRKHFYY